MEHAHYIFTIFWNMNKLLNKPISFLEIEESKMYKWTHFDGIVEYVFVIKKHKIGREDLLGYSRYWFSFLTKKEVTMQCFIYKDEDCKTNHEFIEIA